MALCNIPEGAIAALVVYAAGGLLFPVVYGFIHRYADADDVVFVAMLAAVWPLSLGVTVTAKAIQLLMRLGWRFRQWYDALRARCSRRRGRRDDR